MLALANEKQKRPQAEEPAGVESAAVGGVQVNGGAAAQAVADEVSEPHSNVVAINSGATMSGTLLTRWNLLGRAARDAHLSRSDLAVLHAIADRIGDTGTAWPSVRRIADDANADKRTVTRSIGRLCDCGYLIRKSGGFTTANVYRLGVGEPARRGEPAPMGESTGRGGAVSGYGRTRPEGMGELAHVILPVNPPNESTRASSTASPLTTGPGDGSADGESPTDRRQASTAARGARLAQVTRDAEETFNDSKLTKVNGGLVPNVTPGVGEAERRKNVARCLQEVRAICRTHFESEHIVRDFWVEYWDACQADEHKSGRAGGGKDHGNWLPTFEYLTRPKTLLEVYERLQAAGDAQ